MSPLDYAIQLALKHHVGQYRKEGQNPVKLPMITHPLAVLTRLWRWGIGDEDVLVAAVLHDTVEDTGLTLNEIELHFGHRVASIVNELTFIPDPKNRNKKNEYLKSFNTASLEALVIKFADRLENVWEFMITNSSYAEKYYHKADPLFEAFTIRQYKVSEKFGVSVLASIHNDWNTLKQKLFFV